MIIGVRYFANFPHHAGGGCPACLGTGKTESAFEGKDDLDCYDCDGQGTLKSYEDIKQYWRIRALLHECQGGNHNIHDWWLQNG